jgi:hypothetical protein
VNAPTRLVALASALVALLAACEGGDATPVSPTVTAPTTQPTTPIEITPGHFRYQNAGLVVTLVLEGNTGTMTVDNGSGHSLGRPDLYAFEGVTGARYEGKVLEAAPIDDGDTAEFAVEFPPEITAKSVGLIVLLFGRDNYGSFAPA